MNYKHIYQKNIGLESNVDVYTYTSLLVRDNIMKAILTIYMNIFERT